MTLNTITAPTVTAPTSAGTGWCNRFETPLPRWIRAAANEMTWENVVAEYAHTTGSVRLGHWKCTDAQRAAGRWGRQARNYQATIAIGDRIATSTAAAGGPIAALTAMLYERGIAVEMLTFHQLRSGEYTATFIRGTDGARAEWAMGWSEDSTQSALHAVIACANRLSA